MPATNKTRERAVTETDRDAIVQMINLYELAVDSRRWDLFDRVFTADVEARYSEERHWHDLKSFKRDFESRPSAFSPHRARDDEPYRPYSRK
jgi:hypothetical protein